MCKKNYSGSGYDMVNHTGSDECALNIPIANCEFVMTTQTASYKCYSCKKDYAVAYNEFSCISFTKDQNCRSLAVDGTNCYYCWHSYYWDQSLCKLRSNL